MRLVLKNMLSQPVTEKAPAPDQAGLAELAENLDQAAKRRLGRSLAIREVDAGSCNGCELEIHALANPYYNVEGIGIRFVASPRHADMLLVTGPVSKHMAIALKRTYDATPDPKLVVVVDVLMVPSAPAKPIVRGTEVVATVAVPVVAS